MIASPRTASVDDELRTYSDRLGNNENQEAVEWMNKEEQESETCADDLHDEQQIDRHKRQSCDSWKIVVGMNMWERHLRASTPGNNEH